MCRGSLNCIQADSVTWRAVCRKSRLMASCDWCCITRCYVYWTAYLRLPWHYRCHRFPDTFSTHLTLWTKVRLEKDKTLNISAKHKHCLKFKQILETRSVKDISYSLSIMKVNQQPFYSQCVIQWLHTLFRFVLFLKFVIQHDHLHTREIIQNKLQIYLQACTPTTHSLKINKFHIFFFFILFHFNNTNCNLEQNNNKNKTERYNSKCSGLGKESTRWIASKRETVNILVQQVCITHRIRYNWCCVEVSHNHYHFGVKLQATSARLPSLTAESRWCVAKSEPSTLPGAVFLM